MMSQKYRNAYSYTWIIKNFSFCCQENGDSIKRVFIDKNVSDQSWCIKLYPRGSRGHSDFLSCFLEMNENKNGRAFDYGFKMEIIGAAGESLKTLEGDSSLDSFQEHFEWGSSEFLKIKRVVEDAEINRKDILTVRVYVYGNNPEKPVYDELIERTKIIVDHLTFKCTLDAADDCDNEELLNLPINLPNHYVNGQTSAFELVITNQLPLCVIITEIRENCECCVVKCKLAILDGENEVCSDKSAHFFHSSNAAHWKFPTNIISPTFHSYAYAQRAEINILFKFSCSYGFMVNSLIKNTNTIANNYPNSQKDMESLFLSKNFCDIKLIVDNRIIDAHKVVLAARSKVFQAMFNHDLIETQTGEVTIDDIDVNTMNIFLKFLYSDTLDDIDFEQTKALMLAADKYEVLSLKAKCSDILNSEKSVTNVCEILSLADLVGDNDLKSTAIEFIVSNSAKVLSSPNWLPWLEDNKELTTEILSMVTSAIPTSGFVLPTCSSKKTKKRRIYY